jgi:hypothetical protein
MAVAIAGKEAEKDAAEVKEEEEAAAMNAVVRSNALAWCFSVLAAMSRA